MQIKNGLIIFFIKIYISLKLSYIKIIEHLVHYLTETPFLKIFFPLLAITFV